MEQGDKWIERVARALNAAQGKGTRPKPEIIGVRELLRLYGYSKRGSLINKHIRNKLDELNLRTSPDFENTWFDDRIKISLNEEESDQEDPDPTHRIAILDAAHNRPLSVSRNDPISVATTRMLLHDFSQLPVMQSTHTVSGIISWKTIGARMSLGLSCELVRDCTEPAKKVPQTTPLFGVIGTIAESGYVLVHESETNHKIIGIVTASDLSNQFAQLAGPFLISGQVERHLRNLVHKSFSVEEMQKACGVSAEGDVKSITGAADLTLGEYHRLLGKPERWDKLNLKVDRTEFLKHLDIVRKIRNNVMHFSPDGLSDEELQDLDSAAGFLDSLAQMGAI